MINSRIDDLEHVYSDQWGRSSAYLLVHGVRGGIDEAYIQTLLHKIITRGDVALAINFPYMTRGENKPSGGAFDEEMNTLQAAYDFLRTKDKSPIHIIAKSFGGIAVSYWLGKQAGIDDVSVNIMGYIPGDSGVDADALRGRLQIVVQGENDKYATPEAVRAVLHERSVAADVIEIPNADHSYRDTVNPNPPPYAYQEYAIDELLKRV